MTKLLVLAAACVAATLAAGTGSAITGPKVIRVLEVGVSEVSLDSGEEEPKAGDRFYARNALYGWAGTKRGKRVGRDEVLCTFTAVHFDRGWVSALCTAQFFLPGGSINAQAFIRFTEGQQKFSVPVTGGTGVYANANGWIDIRDVGFGESTGSALVFHLSP